MQPNNPEIFLGDKLIGRANSVTVHKSSAVGKSEHVLAAFARRQQASPHEMFMSPLAVAIALPRLIHHRDERALRRHRIAEYLFLTGAMQ